MEDKRTRILFIGTLPPPIHGSAVVSQQIKDSKLINNAFLCDWVNLGTSRRMDEIGKRSLAKPFRFIGSWLRTLCLLMTHRYALCYLAITCHGIGFLKDAPFVLLCKLFRRKIIIHQHNKGMSKDLDRWPYRWLLPLCYKDAKVILLSWHLYPDIEKVVPKENVMICPNGIKFQEFKNSNGPTSKDSEVVNEVPKLLFLSNLIESKGVIVLLDALKLLADKGYSFQCDFVGGETKEIDAKRFAEEVDKRQLNRLVVYKGRKFGEEKDEAFEKSDIFVFPSMEDCFPLVLLEAMEHRLPIVTTTEGAIPDEVTDGENGLISERNNHESLAVSIRHLLDSPELCKKMGEEGYQKLRKYFIEEVFEHTMHDILNNSVGGQICFVRYLGKKYGEEKNAIFADSDIFVFPTFYDNECFPLVLLEAMSYGLSCVTTSEGGIEDIVMDGVNGLISEKQNPESLADCIEKLLKQQEVRIKMGLAGKTILYEKFTEERFEENILGCLLNAQ